MALARPATGLIANRSGSGLTGWDCLKSKARRGMDDERGPRALVVREQREHGSSLIYGRRGEAYARRWRLSAVFDCGLMAGAVLRSGQIPEMEQRRHLGIRGLKRVSLLRFFSRLKRNEVPPRTGANRNKQENPT